MAYRYNRSRKAPKRSFKTRGRKTYRSNTSTSRLKAIIRATVKRVAEPKTKTANFGKTEMFHNCFFSGTAVGTGFLAHLNNPDLMPQQSGSDSGRIGDQIYLTGFTIKMLIGQKSDRPNVTFRYLIFNVPKGAVPNYANWFINTSANVLLDDPNYDFVKVIKQGVWRPNEAGLTGTGNDEYTFVKRLAFSYKKLLKFGPADGALTHNDSDLYISLMAYDAFGTLLTDNIAYCTATMEMSYRDP